MKLDQGHKQQRKRDEKAKRNRQILGKEKSTKTKHPAYQHHDLEFAGRLRFQDLERHQHNKERHGRFNPFQEAVTGEDDEERCGSDYQLQGCKTKPVASRLHPELNCEREQKNARDPGRERSEHWRQCEEKSCRQPK